MRKLCYSAALVAVAFLLWAASPPADEEKLAQHRNLGKAFYENPTTQAEAVAEFKAALDLQPDSAREKLNYGLALIHAAKVDEGVALLKSVQKSDPKLPHTWFNLGIQYKKAGDTAAAIEQFEGMAKLTPDEPIVHYQLGTLYRAENRTDAAVAEFERAAKLDPRLAAAQFQLYNLYRQGGRRDDATRALENFQRLKKEAEGAAIAEDVDWCQYAEIYDPPVTGLTAGPIIEDSPRPIEKAPGLEGLTRVTSTVRGDFDNDGLMDLCVLTETGAFLYRNTGGKFVRATVNLPQRRFTSAIWIDYDHDYDLDLILLGDTPALFRNQGAASFVDRTADFPFIAASATAAEKLRIDPDSKAFDLVVRYRDHEPVLYRDHLGGKYTVESYREAPPAPTRTAAAGRTIQIGLKGVKSLKLAQDAIVEVKAGSLYLRQWYNGVPITFDVGSHRTVDVVRITWPNGLIQNEVNQATNKSYVYEEAQRLSGSCPMIWTWNGKEIEFITDVLGVAPLGASDGEGTYFPVDHDEYVTIPSRALSPVNGQFDIRVTEELSEVSYLDQIELTAVDHPATAEIFTNEKFKGPPYPEFHLYGVNRRIYPIAARDDSNNDVLPALLAKDRRYPDRFPRNELGVAAPHTLELDFGNAAPTADAVLLLNGWVDWPDGSTFRAASQERPGGLVMPYLQMQNAVGQWITVNQDMGMPAGKPKTIAVPVHWASASRKLRIVTSLCVYWDQIFLSEGPSPADARQHAVSLTSANLHFRGFSAARIHPQRKQPDTFLYAQVAPFSFWNPTPGLYTRYGEVRDLLHTVDDRFVIMGSGDEMLLRFDAASLPPVPAGWSRDYLLKVDGWAKDRDPNTAFSNSVEPLPFHAMSRYPYPMGEGFPDDSLHRRYREEYNTRPALRLLRRLGGTN